MVRSFFFDTYAFYEIIEGNENYKPYAKDVVIFTTRLNLMELHYGLLVKYRKEEADAIYDELVKFTVGIDDKTIKEANEFRKMLKKRKLSYVDCLGYTIARTLNVPFLTGDKEFWDLENVEFVK